MVPARGTTILVLLLAVYLMFLCGRGLFQKEGPPVFLQEQRSGVLIQLGEGFPHPGIYQFSDGMTPGSVIGLTIEKDALTPAVATGVWRPLRDGEALSLRFDGDQLVEIKRNWMSAQARMALNIPLCPDRMSTEDWQALPGAGPHLAQTIEEDRQQNGDFCVFEGLLRVSGIGPARMKTWEQYFDRSCLGSKDMK